MYVCIDAGAFTGGVTGDDDAIRIHPLYPQWQKLVVHTYIHTYIHT